jgi:hypothetical protein
MNKTSRTFRKRYLGILLLIAGAFATAFAVPPGQVLKATNLPALVGPCCFSFNETVAVTEPAKPVAAVVTWSATTGFTFEDEFVGLMVNGGPCRFYGPRAVPLQAEDKNTHTIVWIVFPKDGLTAGTNTFTLCGGGGGEFANDATFNILGNTLAVRLSN